MAAPVEDKIVLPLDTGNTGKKKRTQTRTVGADSVHSDYVVVEDPRSVVSSHQLSTGALSIAAAAQNGTTTGQLWFYNPVGSAVKAQINRLVLENQFVALAVDLLAGEMRCQSFTFTGVGSGALLTPQKRDTNDAAAVCNGRTASTGLTVTLTGVNFARFLQTMDLVTGGAGHWSPDRAIYEWPAENDQIVIRPGEGIVFWNASAVTTANRRQIINVDWDEFE